MCGIVGLIGTNEAAREAFLGLTTLQHRGQDGAGILTYDSDGFHPVKNLGLVESVFTRENMSTLSGNIAIGHARYSTQGRGDLVEIQPFLLNYPFGLGMVHNGNVVNTSEISRELRKKQRRRLLTHSDTEVLLNLLAEGLSKSANQESEDLSFDEICEAMSTLYDRINGSFSVVTLIADHGIVAFRDPNGIRPLVWGKKKIKRETDRSEGYTSDTAYMVASESVALAFNGYNDVQNLQPGEVLFINMKGEVHRKIIRGEGRRHCMFEWVYFASPESVIDGIPVYGSRIELGRSLARWIRDRIQEKGIEADLVCPVPETSRIAAISLSEELGIPYREVLIKNQYIKRTFILESQDKREKAVSLKLSPVRSEIKGKRVILVDDSIVRGTTSRKLIELVRKAGAKEVYFVSTCPPIQYPCYYGIDFPSGKELIAFEKEIDAIEKELSADGVIYLDTDGLVEALKKAGGEKTQMERPCMACLDGQYPTDVACGKDFERIRTADRAKGMSERSAI